VLDELAVDHAEGVDLPHGCCRVVARLSLQVASGS